ncbi:TPA: lipopolysaccharide core heptose(II)-phosphate phosphatase [Escherichia coli]|uniref:Lipopolysaccharide core heptose(II)-phosphate phosphatase n=3 Tax=Escherichia coli TaxID=562 RepID=A0A2X7K3Y2_ECOLX|nr:lipopolysaccharide core heptose(II)-phosphate phosphatase [Escherichia coli]EFA4219136.1 lipopolysaccharide core heptose(II)-phosphate phosphatase [Escherichia coli O19:H42]EFA4233178.1 lipopolysaccharide core heptose(II)-phosphate phosphatase [Escherichia coli O40:H32]EFA4307629.1 lipopolysaccharide core heptose(II)-phosphate phosphatase [Escherichia coli O19]EEZ6065951.1 lipopolysaccharide core heptose(II)-phosphate phosphatase [Escherichia coli]EFB1549518.1 lipopolysaccharide core heptos
MAGYNMMYSYKRVIFFIFLLILALTVTHVVKTPDVVALSSISGKNDHKTRIFLFRHGERCDRSDNLCLSDADGITLLGAEQAVNNGEMFNARVSDYEVYSTDTTRTVQTAKYFSGKAVTVLPELSVCDVTIFDTLKKLAAKNKNTVIFTHNHCLSFIASYMKNWKFEPEYLDGLVMSEENGDLILDGELDLKE